MPKGVTYVSGIVCNLGVGSLSLLPAAIAALEFFAKRSRTSMYCSRYREKFRLALATLATAKIRR